MSENEIVLARPRLPLDSRLAKKYELDQSRWKVLLDTIFPSAQSVESIAMALEYCAARRFDIMKKPVHIVPVWSSEKRGMVETIWPGIGELRTTAMRTGEFAGIDDTVWGPDRTRKFNGQETYYENGKKLKRDAEIELTYPEWAQVRVYRMVGGERVLFAGPKVYWGETYAKASGKSLLPNSMWQQRPRGQLEKCAEAAALRRAFPEEFGGDLVAEEMHGQIVEAGGVVIDHDTVGAPPPRRPEGGGHVPDPFRDGYAARQDGEDISACPDELDSEAFRAWQLGWDKADKELTAKEEPPAPPEKEKVAEKEVPKPKEEQAETSHKDMQVVRILMDRNATLERLQEICEALEAWPDDYKDPKGLLDSAKKRMQEMQQR